MCFFSSLKIQWIYPSKMWVKDCSWAGVNTGLKFHHEFNNVHLEGETPQSKAQHVLYLFRPPSKGVVLLNPCVYVNSLWYWNRNIHRDLVSISITDAGAWLLLFLFYQQKSRPCRIYGFFHWPSHYQNYKCKCVLLGAVSIRKTVLPGMAIPMLKIRRPNGRLIFNMEITIRR